MWKDRVKHYCVDMGFGVCGLCGKPCGDAQHFQPSEVKEYYEKQVREGKTKLSLKEARDIANKAF